MDSKLELMRCKYYISMSYGLPSLSNYIIKAKGRLFDIFDTLNTIGYES